MKLNWRRFGRTFAVRHNVRSAPNNTDNQCIATKRPYSLEEGQYEILWWPI
jgi:hypothetical protein